MQYDLVVAYLLLMGAIIGLFIVLKHWKQIGTLVIGAIYIFFVIWIFSWGTESLANFFLKDSKNNHIVPSYDRSGEVTNEDDYYNEQAQEAYEEYQAEQAAEANYVMCEPCYEKFYCNQMSSCDEAYHCLSDCGMTRLDGDSNGVPCEVICGTP